VYNKITVVKSGEYSVDNNLFLLYSSQRLINFTYPHPKYNFILIFQLLDFINLLIIES